MAPLAGAQFNAKHSRGPGGLFAAQQAAAGKPTGAWAAGPMSYDPKTRKGVGYGTPGGDPRVRALQQKLNQLGLGSTLVVDGDLGPKTTAAIKAAQRRLGLKPDGVVTAQLMVAILNMQPPPRKGAARAKMSGRPASRGKPKAKTKPSTAPAVKATPMYATGTRTRQKAI